jgi:predicted short-subunit dehydrogenase-like oxidoreductase (DUF2520 family)
MKKTLNIIIIGTGNVSWHIANSIRSISNIKLLQAFNHKASKATVAYSKQFKCEVTTNYQELNPNADIYIIAVKDDAIESVVKQLVTLKLKGIVVHTSGSVDVSVLNAVSQHIGVYYPLQTFYPNASIDWASTPLLLEANSKATLAKLKGLAKQVSQKVKAVDSENRLRLHLAAVFACNFTNALYVSAFEIIEKHIGAKDTNLLAPIMLQSFQKLERVHPKQAQTGPAVRNDQRVMKKHLALLKSDKELTAVYKLLSGLIIHQQKTN